MKIAMLKIHPRETFYTVSLLKFSYRTRIMWMKLKGDCQTAGRTGPTKILLIIFIKIAFN